MAPACTPAPAYPPGTSNHSLVVEGTERELLVHMPALGTARTMPLVVDFHGAGSNKEEQSVYSGFDPLADAKGFVVATPDGLDAPTRQWQYLLGDDIAFARALVASLVAEACVDPGRVYAGGISSGAVMSARLACEASDVFHGFGLVAADLYSPALCDSAAQRPMVIFHGTDDGVVPYDGGDVNTGQGLMIRPAEQTAALWAAHDGCAPTPTETSIAADDGATAVVRLDWAECDQPLTFYRIVGGGHTWPGSAIDVFWLGATTDQIDATATMWQLFDG